MKRKKSHFEPAYPEGDADAMRFVREPRQRPPKIHCKVCKKNLNARPQGEWPSGAPKWIHPARIKVQLTYLGQPPAPHQHDEVTVNFCPGCFTPEALLSVQEDLQQESRVLRERGDTAKRGA